MSLTGAAGYAKQCENRPVNYISHYPGGSDVESDFRYMSICCHYSRNGFISRIIDVYRFGYG